MTTDTPRPTVELIVNVAGGSWPREDATIYEALPESLPFTKAYQWSAMQGDTPVDVRVKAVIETIDRDVGRFFPLTNPNETDPNASMFHWDYEPSNGYGNRFDLFRGYAPILCDQWLQILLATVRHLKEDPAKGWQVALWGMPLLPTTRGDVPSMADLEIGGSRDAYGRTIKHLTPLWNIMDFLLVSFYLRDSSARSGPWAILDWTRNSMDLMQRIYGDKCIPAIQSHYSRGSGRHGQFVDYMDLSLQLYAFKLAGISRLWLWFGITSQAAAESEARWVREVFVPAWQAVFGDAIDFDADEPKDPQEEDLVGEIDADMQTEVAT